MLNKSNRPKPRGPSKRYPETLGFFHFKLKAKKPSEDASNMNGKENCAASTSVESLPLLKNQVPNCAAKKPKLTKSDITKLYRHFAEFEHRVMEEPQLQRTGDIFMHSKVNIPPALFTKFSNSHPSQSPSAYPVRN